MPEDITFCRALSRGDLAAAQARLAQVVSSSEAMQTDRDPSFSSAIADLVKWLNESGCVSHVSVSEGVLKTQPPQKIVILTTRNAGEHLTLHLKLCLGRRMKIHALEPA